MLMSSEILMIKIRSGVQNLAEVSVRPLACPVEENSLTDSPSYTSFKVNQWACNLSTCDHPQHSQIFPVLPAPQGLRRHNSGYCFRCCYCV